MGSIGASKSVDYYFKTDWEPGTGPDSATFKDALATGKRWMTRGYSWPELTTSVATEYYLNPDEASVMEDKLKIYAINNNEYNMFHKEWLEDFKRRGIKVTKRKTKIDKMLEEI